MNLSEITWHPYQWHAVLVVGISAFLVGWSYLRAKQQLRRWAADNGWQLLEAKYRLLFKGPFSSRSYHFGGSVFKIRVRDAQGNERPGWAYCPWLSGQPTPIWDERNEKRTGLVSDHSFGGGPTKETQFPRPSFFRRHPVPDTLSTRTILIRSNSIRPASLRTVSSLTDLAPTTRRLRPARSSFSALVLQRGER